MPQDQSTALQRIATAAEAKCPDLDLGDLQLAEIPEEIGSLVSLKRLILGCKQFGPSPGIDEFTLAISTRDAKTQLRRFERLSPLVSLELLDLSDCDQLSSGDLQHLRTLQGLQLLDVSSCRALSSLATLPPLRALRRLIANGCRSLATLPQNRDFENLEHLDLQDCDSLKSVDDIRNLPGLKDCIVKNCIKLTSIKLGGLENLERINSSGCRKLVSVQLELLPKAAIVDFTGCSALRKVAIKELAVLTSITLSGLRKLESLSLHGLARLQTLRLTGCESLSDLSISDPLPPLRKLHLQHCSALRTFAPIRPLISGLKELFMHDAGFGDLPAPLFGEFHDDNMAERVAAHFADCAVSPSEDHDVKVIILGNGRTGKTSLARRLVGEGFQVREASTHAIRLWTKADAQFVPVDSESETPQSVCLHVWDFGGQDIYHSTHRLFLQSRAIYVICWTQHGDGADPAGDKDCDDSCADGLDVRRPLRYWLGQVASIGNAPGSEPPPVLIVRTKVDRDVEAALDPPELRAEVGPEWRGLRQVDFAARTDVGLADVEAWLREVAVPHVLGPIGRRSLGAKRSAVKEQLLVWHRENEAAFRQSEQTARRFPPPKPIIQCAEFDALVRQLCGPESPDGRQPRLFLDFLHQSGVVYVNTRFLPDTIILDQRWAIDGIYTLFRRDGEMRESVLWKLGRFKASDLARLGWNRDGYTDGEQSLFINFMESCGICFALLSGNEEASGETLYAAPALFPTADRLAEMYKSLGGAQAEPEEAIVCCTLNHPALGASAAQQLLSWVGRHWSRSATYWRWGASFSSAKTEARMQIDWFQDDGGAQNYEGRFEIKLYGVKDRELFETVLKVILRQNGLSRSECKLEPKDLEWASEPPPMEPITAQGQGEHRESVDSGASPSDTDPAVLPAPSRAEAVRRMICFSFAGADENHPRIGLLPRGLAEKLRQFLKERRSNVSVLSYHFPDGHESLRHFELELAKGDLIFVFLSEKYWNSPDCMIELMNIYMRLPGHRMPPEQVVVFAYPGSQLSSSEKPGFLWADRIRRNWEERAEKWHQDLLDETKGKLSAMTERKKFDRKTPWWEFVGDEKEFREFIESMTGYRLYQGIKIPEVGEELAEVERLFSQERKKLAEWGVV